MLLNPFTTMLSTTASLTAENTGPGRLTLPGHFGLRCPPAMENGSTGATRAFPSCRAISTLARRAISVWPPRTACGPRCSVPPLYISTVVFPVCMAAAISGYVINSMSTCCCAVAGAVRPTARMVARTVRFTVTYLSRICPEQPNAAVNCGASIGQATSASARWTARAPGSSFKHCCRFNLDQEPRICKGDDADPRRGRLGGTAEGLSKGLTHGFRLFRAVVYDVDP